jgi:hypothetical protein
MLRTTSMVARCGPAVVRLADFGRAQGPSEALAHAVGREISEDLVGRDVQETNLVDAKLLIPVA